MFVFSTETIQANQIIRHTILSDGSPLSFAQAIEFWVGNREFRSQFVNALADAPLRGFRWETPPVTQSNAKQPFEFVLLDASSFCSRRTDSNTYRDYFKTGENGVAVFPNLRGDATLVVPCPQTEVDAYGHLAAFVRNAPESQLDNFWQVVGQTLQASLNDRPIWLNTAGGGVAWLHVRLDSAPKYYGYAPYMSLPSQISGNTGAKK